MFDTTQNIDLTKIREIFHSNESANLTLSTDDQNGTTGSISDSIQSDETFPGFSQEERKLLINKIIEKRRNNRNSLLQQQRQQQQYRDFQSLDNNNIEVDSVSTIAATLDENHDDDIYENQKNRQQVQNVPETWEEHSTYDNGYDENRTNIMNNMNRNYSHQVSTPNNHIHRPTHSNAIRSSSNPNSARYSSASGRSFSRGSSPRSGRASTGGGNGNNFESATRVLNEMMKDCTFTPQIKKLPEHYGAATKTFENIPFYDRVVKWQKDKKAEILKKKRETSDSDLTGCTFKPKINRNSVKAVEEIRKNMLNSNDGDVHNRLYKGSELSLEQRAKFIEDELVRERKEEELECTFQPQINHNSKKFAEIVPRYSLTAQKKDVDPAVEQVVRKECTFTPKVKPPRAHMTSAQQYLSNSVVDRLTRPMSIEMITRPGERSLAVNCLGEHVFDDFQQREGRSRSRSVSTIERSQNVSANGSQHNGTHVNMNDISLDTAGSSNTGRILSFNQRLLNHDHNQRYQRSYPSSSRERNENKRSRSVDTAIERQAQLDLFLSRLEQSQLRRDRHIEEVKRSTTPTFQPVINSQSKQIVKDRFKSDSAFLDRMERYLLRKQDNQTRDAIYALAQDKNFTYKPQLNKASERLKGRSVYDLSFGDLIKKESAQRVLKLRIEQEELANLTFQPEISHLSKSSKISSALRLNQDPSFHLEYKKSKQDMLVKQRIVEEEKRKEKEMQGCSFQPSTIECPDYIKRIAQSMSMIKNAKLNNQSLMSNSTMNKSMMRSSVSTSVIYNKPDWK